ncbi:MAG: hypothetical protein NTX25_16970 [Proteobacteria bacterium]|nr:hypothetical protein [Pseudomonadota bacterium]
MRSLCSLLLGLHLSLSINPIASASSPNGRLLNLPIRPASAQTGSAFLKGIKKLSSAQREKAIVREILKGNVPSFERSLTPVEKKISTGPYRGQTLRYWTLPDYLSVGSDQDFVIVPLNMDSIKILAEKLDLSLPTKKMVDDIYSQAKIKLSPSPLPLNREITSTSNIIRHDMIVQNQMQQTSWQPGNLVAGHKKDVVQSRRLTKKPQAIAIYGWHQRDKKPIQPLCTAHNAQYADYSHGVRLIANGVEIGTKTLDIRDILSQKQTAGLLSDEGVIPQPVHITGRSIYPVASH